MKLKTDPAINSLTVIYTKGLKLYENQTLSQTSKNIFQTNYKDTRRTMLKHSFFVNFVNVFFCWCIFRSKNSEEL